MSNPSDQRPCRRFGIAAVEFAVVLPVIVLLMLGAIELSRGVMITHALQEAAQAGCRVYSVEGTTQSQARAIVDAVMAGSDITDHTVVFEPASKSGVDVHMEPVTVTVSIPYSDVAWMAPNFLGAATLQGACVMPADLEVGSGGDTNGYNELDDDNLTDGIDRVDDFPPDDDD